MCGRSDLTSKDLLRIDLKVEFSCVVGLRERGWAM